MNIKKHSTGFAEPSKQRGYGKIIQDCIGIAKEYAAMLYVRWCMRFSIGISIGRNSPPHLVDCYPNNAHTARLLTSCHAAARKILPHQ